jgi:hypothetical protein
MALTGVSIGGLSKALALAKRLNKAANEEQNARRNADMLRVQAQEAAAPDPSQSDFDKRRRSIIRALARGGFRL